MKELQLAGHAERGEVNPGPPDFMSTALITTTGNKAKCQKWIEQGKISYSENLYPAPFQHTNQFSNILAAIHVTLLQGKFDVHESKCFLLILSVKKAPVTCPSVNAYYKSSIQPGD